MHEGRNDDESFHHQKVAPLVSPLGERLVRERTEGRVGDERWGLFLGSEAIYVLSIRSRAHTLKTQYSNLWMGQITMVTDARLHLAHRGYFLHG